MTENPAYGRPTQSESPAPAPSGQVAEALLSQERVVENLFDVVTEIEQRLSGVLRQDPEKAGPDGSTPPREVLVPVANAIAVNSDKVGIASSRLRQILGALEL